MRRIRGLAAVLIASSIALTTSACSDDEGTKPSELSGSTSTNAATPTSIPAETLPSEAPDSDEQAVIAAYKGFFNTVVTLGEASGSIQVREMLSPYGAGVAVDRIVQAMETFRAVNQEPGGVVTFSDIVVQVDGGEATTTECRDGSTELVVDATTKQQLNQGSPHTLFTATLQTENGSAWRVVDYDTSTGGC